MTRLFAIAAAFLVIGGGTYLYTNQTGNAPINPASAQVSEDVELVADMTLGDPDAPVEVVEYAWFACPACREFHNGPFKELKQNYIDTGMVHFTYREVFFPDRNGDVRIGFLPAVIARCAGPERYFGVVEMLYAQHDEWVSSPDFSVMAQRLARIGRVAGLSDDEINACFTDADAAESLYATWLTNQQADDISQTPTLFINGERFNGQSYGAFFEQIDAAAEG